MVKVTVNGQSVEEVVKQEAADEILEVRESENKFRIKRSVKTKHNGNHSGERTSPAVSLYLGDPKTTHVFAHNAFWPKDGEVPKFPAERAGLSGYGMVEFCEHTQEFKCHECGMWQEELGHHVTWHHKEYRHFRDYKIKFGMRLGYGIISPARKERARLKAKANNLSGLESPGDVAKRNRSGKTARSREIVTLQRRDTRKSPERTNIKRLCRAQTIADFKEFYVALGRTPTAPEIRNYTNKAGVHSFACGRIRELFGSRSGFFACAGIPMRKPGRSINPEQGLINSRRQKAKWAAMPQNERLRRVAQLQTAWQESRLTKDTAEHASRTAFQTASMKSITRD